MPMRTGVTRLRTTPPSFSTMRIGVRTVAWMCVICIVVLSLVPGDMRPVTALAAHVETATGYLHLAGRLEHFAAYSGTAILFALGYTAAPSRFATFVFLLCLAALLESAQLWVPGRTGRLADFGASALGVCIGIWAVFASDRVRTQQLLPPH